MSIAKTPTRTISAPAVAAQPAPRAPTWPEGLEYPTSPEAADAAAQVIAKHLGMAHPEQAKWPKNLAYPASSGAGDIVALLISRGTKEVSSAGGVPGTPALPGQPPLGAPSWPKGLAYPRSPGAADIAAQVIAKHLGMEHPEQAKWPKNLAYPASSGAGDIVALLISRGTKEVSSAGGVPGTPALPGQPPLGVDSFG